MNQIPSTGSNVKAAAVEVLYYLPVIALSLSFVMDVAVAIGVWPSDFRIPGEKPLTSTGWNFFYWGIACLLLALNGFLCHKVSSYAKATEALLGEYRKWLRDKHYRKTFAEKENLGAPHFLGPPEMGSSLDRVLKSS